MQYANTVAHVDQNAFPEAVPGDTNGSDTGYEEPVSQQYMGLQRHSENLAPNSEYDMLRH